MRRAISKTLAGAARKRIVNKRLPYVRSSRPEVVV